MEINIILEDSVKIKEEGMKTLALVFGNKNIYSYEDKKIIVNILEREAESFFPFQLSKEEFSKINIIQQ